VKISLFSSLFEPDNVRTGVSWKKILDLGGIKGLEDKLNTSSKVKCLLFRLEFVKIVLKQKEEYKPMESTNQLLSNQNRFVKW
jgi:hypothetical protein